MITPSFRPMRKYLWLLIMWLLYAPNAYSEDLGSIKDLFKVADLVLRIRMPDNPVNNVPSVIHDLGTDDYFFVFTLLHIYKQRPEQFDNTMVIRHRNGMLPITELLRPGAEYIVFLKKNGTQMLIDDGISPFRPGLDRQLGKILRHTAFDRAVTAGRWKEVERKIRRHVRREAFQHRSELSRSIQRVNTWLQSRNTVDAIRGDSCAIHIDIYPGWIDEGIRFLTPAGPAEYNLAISLGRVRRYGCIYRCVGMRGPVDKIVFRSFTKVPGLLETFRRSCIYQRFQQISNWKPQPDIELVLSHPYDTIQPVSMNPPLMRMKTKMINRSGSALTILWPDRQKDGSEVILFSMLGKEGEQRTEDGDFLEMPGDETTGPSMISLQPGDSLIAWHSINDPYCRETSASANHDIDWIPSGDWKIGLTYRPVVDAGDTGIYWKPAGGWRDIWCAAPIHIRDVVPAEEITLTARVLTGKNTYTGKYQQQGIYNLLAEVKAVPPACAFKAGDTLAFRAHPNVCYLLSLGVSRPAMDVELIQPEDIVEIDFTANYPPDEFTLPGGRNMLNFLMLNKTDALRIIRD